MSEQATARVGCSGWVYRDWRGPVYPPDLPQKYWFGVYAGRFSTVELNSTFYRLPTADTVARWAKQAPEGFVYSVKVGQFGTHRKRLKDPAGWLGRHVERIEGLGPHLGPNLAQLPPRFRRDPARLDEFLAAAPPAWRWAVEFRDPSWLHDEVFAVLERHGAALCIHDLLPGHPWLRTTDWTYVRFHGPDAARRAYHGRYTGRRLWRVADRLGAWLDEGCDAYAYFN
ncbi:MAG TPA: DUF72 domain-containing protein, partial [Acidimicrobiia bacterium]|nr:DUF72 domain-containing protein [Acidimicrobiia bacterium]